MEKEGEEKSVGDDDTPEAWEERSESAKNRASKGLQHEHQSIVRGAGDF